MKVFITRQELLEAINKVKSVVAAKSALPILSHILIEAKDGRIRLSATDLKISIECTVECQVKAKGALTVSSARLASIVSELPEGELALELVDSSVVLLKSGKINTKLFSMSPDEFPPLRAFEGVEPLVLPKSLLKSFLLKTSFAISEDQARYNLTGCLFELHNGKLNVVATDGRRMSLYIETENIPDGVEIKVIIPGKMVRELERLLSDEGEVRMFFGENQAAFEFDSLRLVTALIEGNFPNYEMVIPRKHDKIILVNTRQFLDAMRRTRTMTNDKFNSVRFLIEEDKMTFKVITPEVGEYEEDISIEYSGDPIEIAFNPDFVLDVLRHIDSDMTSVVLKDPMSPALLRPTDNASSEKYINVVMPIRI